MFGQIKFASLVLLAIGAISAVQAAPILDDPSPLSAGQFTPGQVIPGFGQVVSVSALGIVTVNVGNGQLVTFDPSDLPNNQKRSTILVGQLLPGLGRVVYVDALSRTVTVDVGGGQTQTLPIPTEPTDGLDPTLSTPDSTTNPDDGASSTTNSKRFVKPQSDFGDVPDFTQDGHDPFINSDGGDETGGFVGYPENYPPFYNGPVDGVVSNGQK